MMMVDVGLNDQVNRFLFIVFTLFTGSLDYYSQVSIIRMLVLYVA